MYTFLSVIHLIPIFGLPLLSLAGIFGYSDDVAYRCAVILVSPILFTLSTREASVLWGDWPGGVASQGTSDAEVAPREGRPHAVRERARL
jgi:hypothetical protein